MWYTRTDQTCTLRPSVLGEQQEGQGVNGRGGAVHRELEVGVLDG